MSAKTAVAAPAGWRNRITGAGEEAPDQLLANPANWRIHPKAQQDALAGALDAVGWVQQVLVNRCSGFVVDGHARVALALTRGEATVPVLYVDLDPDEEALVLATLDPIGAMAGRDDEKLRALLADVTVDDAGLLALLGDLAGSEPKAGLTDPDEVPEPPEEPYVKLGELYRLGDHRILCGDATNAEEDIADWLDAHADAVLVAIDTLGKVRGASDGRRNAYEVDVAAMARLQDLFRDRPVALVIVHHARKESTDDFLTSVSGTYGITGSADTIVVIRRKRNEAFGTLHVTGRDVPDEEISARFDDLTWTAAPGALSAASFERGEVYRVVEARGPVFAKSIADELGMERTSVQHIVAGLVEQGAVARVKGGYVAAGVVIDTSEPLSLPLHSTHSTSEERGGGHPRAGTPAREADLFVACDAYRDHQSEHFHTPAGWRCQICTPLEEGPTA